MQDAIKITLLGIITFTVIRQVDEGTKRTLGSLDQRGQRHTLRHVLKTSLVKT